MSDLKPYLYTCDYLSHLVYVENLTGIQVLEQLVEMDNWLSVNKISRMWSVGEMGTTRIGKNCVGYPLSSNPANLISVSRYIYFTDEQDLLAFRLRWGIQA